MKYTIAIILILSGCSSKNIHISPTLSLKQTCSDDLYVENCKEIFDNNFSDKKYDVINKIK